MKIKERKEILGLSYFLRAGCPFDSGALNA